MINKDTLIIVQILTERDRLIKEKSIHPDIVFVHPELFEQTYSEIGQDGNRLKVYESELMGKTQFILSVEVDIGSISLEGNKNA